MLLDAKSTTRAHPPLPLSVVTPCRSTRLPCQTSTLHLLLFQPTALDEYQTAQDADQQDAADNRRCPVRNLVVTRVAAVEVRGRATVVATGPAPGPGPGELVAQGETDTADATLGERGGALVVVTLMVMI